MFFKTHQAPSIMIGPTITLGVILNSNILRECIALREKNANYFLYLPIKADLLETLSIAS